MRRTLTPLLIVLALVLGTVPFLAQSPASAPTVVTPHPILDAPLTPALPVGYQFWIAHADEIRAEVTKWYAEANGRTPAPSDINHGVWRALYEGDRWRTLRSALQDTWPKPGQMTYADAVALINPAYQELLFRLPDEYGLLFYSSRLMDGRMNDVSMRADIKASPEYAIKHPPVGAARVGPFTKRGSSFVDGAGREFNATETTLFWALWAEENDPAKLDANLSAVRTQGHDAIRLLGMVGGGSWEDRTINPKKANYWSLVDALFARLQRHGVLARVTLFAAAQDMMSARADRERFVDQWAPVLTRYKAQVLYAEIANEYWQNGLNTQELRDLTRRLNQQTDVLVAASSPACGSWPEGNDAQWRQEVTDGKISDSERRRRVDCQAEWTLIYGNGAADLITFHFDRDSSKSDGYWRPARQPWEMQFGAFNTGTTMFSNGEPIGPQSSVYSDVDPERLAMGSVITWLAKGASYTLHTGAGVRGGGQADVNLGRVANLWEVPNVAATTAAIGRLRAVLPPLANCNPIPAGATGSYVLSVTPASAVVRSYQTECPDGSFVATAFGLSAPITLRMQRPGSVTLTAYRWDGTALTTFNGDASAVSLGPFDSSVVVVGRR
jgi:hypothetical protein